MKKKSDVDFRFNKLFSDASPNLCVFYIEMENLKMHKILNNFYYICFFYMFSLVSQTKDSRLSPLRHGSSGKGMGEGLCEVLSLSSSPNGDKKLPIKKKRRDFELSFFFPLSLVLSTSK